MIPVYSPYLDNEIMRYPHDAINSRWISSHGDYLGLVKTKLVELNGKGKVLLCNNGTAANHLMAMGLRYKYPSITNIVAPNNVYVAAWNTFLVNPVFNLIPIDCDPRTWNISHDELHDVLSKSSPQETAILIVHNIGNIVNVPRLKLKYPAFTFIEDNCEGFLGEYEEIKSGSSSIMSSVSFFGNKIITSGEGGALFTEDEELYEYLDSVRCQGSTQQKFVFDKIGYNYRMTNVQAAILYGQTLNIEKILEQKRRVFSIYRKSLSEINFQSLEAGTTHSNWMFGVDFKRNIQNIAEKMYKLGIETRPMFYPMSKHKHLEKFSRQETNAKILSEQCLIFPSSPNLTDEEVYYICDSIKGVL